MKRYLLPLAAAGLAVLLLIPAVVSADDDEYEKDAMYAEGNPPMVPHRMVPDTTGDACLACHLEGKNGATLTPHAVRIDCVQCHGQGEIREPKRSADKKKQKHKVDK